MVEVTRSDFIKSAHYGVAVLINSNGEILREWGNSNILIYPRSALKPIQSLNLYKDGVAEGLNLSDDFIALTTASHHAENIHQKMINNWLKKIYWKICRSYKVEAKGKTYLALRSECAQKTFEGSLD